MALDPSREGPESPVGRFDYSETHFFANALGKTTPKLVSLPKKAQNPPCAMQCIAGKAGVLPGRPTSGVAVAGREALV